MGGPPYSAVVLILSWAADNFGELDGACLLDGLDLLTLPFPRYLNVVATVMLRGVEPEVGTNGTLSYDNRSRLSRMLVGGEEEAAAVPTWEEWGTSREAIAGLHAAMATVQDENDHLTAMGG